MQTTGPYALLYQCRVQIDSTFSCTRSNVQLTSTRYFAMFCVPFSLRPCHLKLVLKSQIRDFLEK
jgi:hypothetical protein